MWRRIGPGNKYQHALILGPASGTVNDLVEEKAAALARSGACNSKGFLFASGIDTGDAPP
jgi:hypothetical protein